MSHERSITIPEGEGYTNAYGPGNDTGAPVGTRLPGERTYSQLDPAVVAAEQRSGGIRPQVGGLTAPSPLYAPTPQIGVPRLNERLGLPERSLSSTVDQTPMGQKLASEREPVRGSEPLDTDAYLAAYPDAVSARAARDKDPGNVALRNAEHYRFAQEVARQVHPLGAVGAVLGYSAMKALSQGMPETGKALLGSMGVSLPRTTDRPMEEIEYGLKGAMNPNPGSAPRLRGRYGK